MTERAITIDPATHQCDATCPVEHLLRAHGEFLDPESTLRTAARIMLRHGVGAVLLRGPELPDSIVTEHDIVGALADGADPDTVWVADVASSPVVTVATGSTLADAAHLMVARDVRSLPVMRDAEAVGIVFSDDLLATLSRLVATPTS